MLSAHAWAVIGLCSLPLLVVAVRLLLDADRPPDNTVVHEQDADEGGDRAEIRLAA